MTITCVNMAKKKFSPLVIYVKMFGLSMFQQCAEHLTERSYFSIINKNICFHCETVTKGTKQHFPELNELMGDLLGFSSSILLEIKF